MKRVNIKEILYICMFLALIAARRSNFESFVFGHSPTKIGMLFSCIYYIVWLLILLFTRFEIKLSFILFAIYWGINFTIGVLGCTGILWDLGENLGLPLVYLFVMQLSGFNTEMTYLIALIASSIYLALGTYKWVIKKY